MIQMIVIDDEALVRMGIQRMVPWNEFGVNVIAEAVDGDEGLQKILEYNPEIILVDIRMPGMNGIEVCKRAKEQGATGKFIIMSAYSEFAYAKEAITIGVENYLLKPIEKEELVKQVTQIRDQLMDQQKTRMQLDQQKQEARHEVIRQLLIEEKDKSYLDHQLQYYGLDQAVDRLYVAVIFNPAMILRNQMEWKEQMTRFFANTTGTELLFWAEEMIVVNTKLPLKKFEAVLTQILHWLQKEKNPYFRITIGQCVHTWKDLNYSYESACFLKENIFLYEKDHVISLEDMKKQEVELPENVKEQIQTYIQIGDISGLERITKQCQDYIQSRFYQEGKIKIFVTNAVISIQASLAQKMQAQGSRFPKESVLVEHVSKSRNIVELRENMMVYFQRLIAIMSVNYEQNMIEKVKRYMEMNYSQALTIDCMARQFHYNNSYFGQLFKQQTGYKFHEVLDYIRMEEAAKLLRNSDVRIYEIAKKVGVSDPDRFAAKFKKQFGMSAKEYREQIEREKP